MCRKLVEYPSGFELDHKVPLFKGGRDDHSNLQVLCPPCHEVKTADDRGFKQGPEFDEQGRVIWNR